MIIKDFGLLPGERDDAHISLQLCLPCFPPQPLIPESCECSDWWGSGEKNRVLGVGVGMKCRFINSAGAKSLERRLVAKRLMVKRLAGSSM